MGVSLRDTYTKVEDAGGYVEELHPDPCPISMVYLMDWFTDLSGGRQASSSGINPITFEQIWCWAKLLRIDIEPWEVKVLRKIDVTFVNIEREAANNRLKR